CDRHTRFLLLLMIVGYRASVHALRSGCPNNNDRGTAMGISGKGPVAAAANSARKSAPVAERIASGAENEMITDQELRQFIEDGAVTIGTPLTEAQIAAASAAFDRLLPFSAPPDGRPRYRVGMTCSYDDPALLEIIQHPFFEEVAKRALRADEVQFFQTA